MTHEGANQEETKSSSPSARERLINAAYILFSRHGVAQIGIERILGEAGCAKASLYNHFKSKSELALAFLNSREERWTRSWLENQLDAHQGTAEDKLLFIFDIFDDWFRQPDFEGCPFINVLLESHKGSAVREMAAGRLATIRGIIAAYAREACLAEPEAFAQSWHMLMKGSIIAAGEGNADAGIQAKQAAHLILVGWPRT